MRSPLEEGAGSALTPPGRADEIVLSFLRDDPPEPFLEMATSSGRSYWFSRWVKSLYCRYVVGDEWSARLLDANCGKSINDVQRWMDRRNQYILKTRQLVRPVAARSR